MGMPAMQERLWTAREVLDLPDVPGLQFEVIDGELFVTPAPSFDHQEVLTALWQRIATWLLANRVGRAIVAPADVEIAPDTLVQPDLFVLPLVNGRRARTFAEAGRLLLAADVLSPRSVTRDAIRKRDLFARLNVEYWIVDPEARTIEQCAPGRPPEVRRDSIMWHPADATASLAIDVPALFADALDD